MFERLLSQPPYSLRQSEKEPLLLEGLNELTRYHYENSPEYKRILDAAWGGLKTYGSIAEVPYLPVSLFKEMELKSTALPAMVMRSSGTTGQRTSRIVIDNETARRQSEALVASFRPILGSRRLPFLAIDTKDVIKPTDLTARGGGVLGMMKFGAKTAFALNSPAIRGAPWSKPAWAARRPWWLLSPSGSRSERLFAAGLSAYRQS